MCGIVGYVGMRSAQQVLLDGLEKLEYRGYDSAGVALTQRDGIRVVKSKGRLSTLRSKLEELALPQSSCGIGHTRWATHGEPSDVNSHPHSTPRVSIVHNGIIENYGALKERLIAKGYTFASETDTEVLVKLIDSCYQGEPLQALQAALAKVRGSYALAVLFKDYPDTIFAVKRESPLIVGWGEGENFVASDIPALLKYTRSYSVLEEGDMAVCTAQGIRFYNEFGEAVEREKLTADWDMEAAEKGGYPHFMLKEINEEPAAITATVSPRVENGLPELRIPELTDEKLLIWNGDAFILTTVIPAIIMIVINLLLISSKLRISPLNFLRRDLSRRKRKKAVKLPHFKFFNRFRIRIILQNRAGYLTLFIGIAFAEILLVFGMMMSPLLEHYQDEVLSHMLADYQYVLKAPVPTETDGAETYLAGSLKTMPTEFSSEEVSVYGVEKDSAYVDIDFPKEGVYISDSYAEKYRLAEGDTIELKETYGDKKYKFKVAGIYEYPAAVAIFMPEEEYRDVFDKEEDYFNGYFSDKKITDIEDAYIMTTITEDDLTKVSRQLDVSMGGMFYLMNVFSVALAAILIYLMTKLIIERNASSISMVKILGYNTREIGKLYLTATTWIVVISVILGEAIATETINVIYRAMMSDYSGWLSIYYDPNIYWKILLMVLAAYFVVALFCLRKIRKIPMDEALKNVE